MLAAAAAADTLSEEPSCAEVLVRWYMVMTGMTRRMKITKVMSMLTSLSMRELL